MFARDQSPAIRRFMPISPPHHRRPELVEESLIPAPGANACPSTLASFDSTEVHALADNEHGNPTTITTSRDDAMRDAVETYLRDPRRQPPALRDGNVGLAGRRPARQPAPPLDRRLIHISMLTFASRSVTSSSSESATLRQQRKQSPVQETFS